MFQEKLHLGRSCVIKFAASTEGGEDSINSGSRVESPRAKTTGARPDGGRQSSCWARIVSRTTPTPNASLNAASDPITKSRLDTYVFKKRGAESRHRQLGSRSDVHDESKPLEQALSGAARVREARFPVPNARSRKRLAFMACEDRHLAGWRWASGLPCLQFACMIALRIGANGAVSSNSVLPSGRFTPSSFHNALRSTGAGADFIFL